MYLYNLYPCVQSCIDELMIQDLGRIESKKKNILNCQKSNELSVELNR